LVASPQGPESAAEDQRARRSPLEFVADVARVEQQKRDVWSQRIDNIGGDGKPDMPIQPKDG